jgi:hypothetical protein
MPAKRARQPFIKPERRRAQPVTVTKLPVVQCQVCRKKMAHRPGEASKVLTKHYEKEHPEYGKD